MVSRKYVGDYRLENVPDRHGKLKTVPVYRGPLFRFKAEETKVKRAKVRCLTLTALLTCALMVTMLLRVGILQRIYVVMPLVLSIPPAILLWMGVYNLLTAAGGVTREKSDHIHNRFAGWSVVLIALNALSLIGQCFAYFSGAEADGVPVTVCTVVCTVCASLIFAGKKDLTMEEIPPEE